MSLEQLDHIVSGVLFDFGGYLTTRDSTQTLARSNARSSNAPALHAKWRINAQHPEFFAGFVGSQASMTPRTDEACEELRVLSIDSPTLHEGLERLNYRRFCALTFELSRAWRQTAYGRE